MTNKEIIEELLKREEELATQAEFEFDEILAKKFIKNFEKEIDSSLLKLLVSNMRYAFITGARFGFLKYIENRIEQKKWCNEP